MPSGRSSGRVELALRPTRARALPALAPLPWGVNLGRRTGRGRRATQSGLGPRHTKGKSKIACEIDSLANAPQIECQACTLWPWRACAEQHSSRSAGSSREAAAPAAAASSARGGLPGLLLHITLAGAHRQAAPRGAAAVAGD
jgi:hypothetical protein